MIRRQDNWAGMATRLQAGQLTIFVRRWARNFSLQNVQIACGVPPFDTECTVLGREADHSPRSSTRLRMRGTIPPFPHLLSWRAAWLSSGASLPVFLWMLVDFRRSAVGCVAGKGFLSPYLLYGVTSHVEGKRLLFNVSVNYKAPVSGHVSHIIKN